MIKRRQELYFEENKPIINPNFTSMYMKFRLSIIVFMLMKTERRYQTLFIYKE